MYIFYTILVVISFVVIGYLFGSVLFGAIIGKLTNVNPRETGSKNVGGTNVSRALGPHFGILVTLLDATKSYLSIIVCWVIFRYSISIWYPGNTDLYPLIYIAGIFACIGHCWPIQYFVTLFNTHGNFVRAKTKTGGKGVSCAGGTLLAISPWLGLIAFTTFVVIFLIFRYVSLGSMICMTLPAFMIFIPGIDYIYLFDHSLLYKDNYHPEVLIQMWIMFIILCNSSIMIIRHIPNIKRLLRHEEKRFF